MRRGLFLFLRAKNKKVPKKVKRQKDTQGRYKNIVAKKSQECCRGINIFGYELRFYVNAIRTTLVNIQKKILSYQLSPCCCHISFLLFLVHPAPLPTEGFTASFVQTSQRFRTCQNQEGAAYNKKEIELPLILNSKCVLSINFRPFANPPLESLLGKADFSSGELTFRHFSKIFEDRSKLSL